MTYGKTRPYPARLVEKRDLAGASSARATLHVALAIEGAGFAYEPGDTIHVHAENAPALVDAVLGKLELEGDDAVVVNAQWRTDGEPGPLELSLRSALTSRLGLGAPSLKLLRAAAERLEDEDEAIALEDLCDDDSALDAYLLERDLLDLLGEHPSLRFSAAELATLLPALQPRTYSVASSQRVHPGEVHLTVGLISWDRAGRARSGVASAHFARMRVGDTMPISWQPSAHFRMPGGDPPLVLLGPGTGIAPFRGFLEERAATSGAPLWLFFGAQTAAHDFYYRDELEGHLRAGTLARLDVAFSRDQPERVYVQQRMREAAAELIAWIGRGAHVYLCGDASKMAPDVERTLDEVLGAGTLDRLKAAHRYRRDVY